ncbi:hypothetical protein [Thalassospira alkalitolerans]|uniref:hypothetical protein n=1 Tax=Thalassospira alkalitolerans TaxID=1293890 RepID=UPI003AA80524
MIGFIKHNHLNIAKLQLACIDGDQQTAGVATNTSTPGVIALICGPWETPTTTATVVFMKRP